MCVCVCLCVYIYIYIYIYVYIFADRNIKKEVMEQIEKLNCNKLLRPDGIHQRVVEE